MGDQDRSVNPCLRRSTDGAHPQNNTNSELQRLMWVIFYYEKKYDKRELAEFLGIAVDTFHAYCNGDLRLHVDTARKVIEFIAAHNPKDRRLINHLLPPGYVAVPLLDGHLKTSIDEVIDLAIDLRMKIKKEGRAGA